MVNDEGEAIAFGFFVLWPAAYTYYKIFSWIFSHIEISWVG